MKGLLLVDGHNLLFRSFYGIPARIIGTDGTPVNAVVGVIGRVLRMLRSEAATSILVAFDSETGSFRDQQFAEYKAGRVRDFSNVDVSENPFSQLQPLKIVLDWLGWKYCEVDGVEADDVIAEYSRAIGREFRCTILSADNDFLQLVGPNVTVIGSRDRRYTPSEVIERYGVTPPELPLFKALTGDPSDNIQGVQGIGPKTAASLINRFGSMDKLYANLSGLPDRLSESLNDSRQQVFEALQLMTLNHPVDLPFSLDELSVSELDQRLTTMTILREARILK